MQVTVYSKNYCPYCDKAKALLDAHNIDFEEINVQAPGETRSIPAHSNMKTFPQIFVGHTLVGGFDQLLQLHQQQGLKHGLQKIADANGD